MVIAPSSEAQGGILDVGTPGVSLDFTVNGSPVLSEPVNSDELPDSLWQSLVTNPWEYVRDKTSDLTSYLFSFEGITDVAKYNILAPGAMAQAHLLEQTGVTDQVHTILDDPDLFTDEFAYNYGQAQQDYVQAAENTVKNAIPFASTFGKLFSNPILILVLVVLAMALWFIGPAFRKATA